jgi:antitoxin component YwqK of YwqJK toxin-antitoxin module
LPLIAIILLLSCTDKKNEEVNLVMKDKLLYQIGSDKPFTGTEKAILKDKFIEYDVIDGVKNGKFKMYYSDYTLQMSGYIENNKNTGKWQYFYPDGKLESVGDFVNDFPEGEWKWYFLNGNLKEQGNFIRGIRIGEWKFYNELGIIDSTLKFELRDSSFVDKDSLIKN